MKEIQAKTLLAHVKQPDTWFGLKYNMNLYRGCQHRCIYCDSRSECYQIDHFDSEVLIKANAIELLQKELARKRVRGSIGLGLMNDPYMPLEREVNLTGRALAVIQAHEHGASYIIPWFGMSLRDRQRAYYCARLDEQFPGLRQKYERTYGQRYVAPCPMPTGWRRWFTNRARSMALPRTSRHTSRPMGSS